MGDYRRIFQEEEIYLEHTNAVLKEQLKEEEKSLRPGENPWNLPAGRCGKTQVFPLTILLQLQKSASIVTRSFFRLKHTWEIFSGKIPKYCNKRGTSCVKGGRR
ncbi:MAG TPA: hypothetical protein GX691_01310 [Clostridia bacterium]|jgi:hypothetical protein|nr:hypothetical protein [Clostridia bacterium]